MQSFSTGVKEALDSEYRGSCRPRWLSRTAIAADGAQLEDVGKENAKRRLAQCESVGKPLSDKHRRVEEKEEKVGGERHSWVSWRDAAGNLVMAEKEQARPLASGAAAAESKGNLEEEEVTITGCVQVRFLCVWRVCVRLVAIVLFAYRDSHVTLLSCDARG